MIRVALMFILLLGVASPIWAETRYVAADITEPCSTYNPTTGLCSGGTANAYKTVEAGLRALVASDRLEIRGGSYTLSVTCAGFRFYGCTSSSDDYGGGATSWETATVITNYPGETVTITGGFNMDIAVQGSNNKYIIFQSDGDRTHFVIQGASGTSQGGNAEGFRMVGVNHIRLKDLTIKNHGNTGIGAGKSGTTIPDNLEVISNLITNNGNDTTQEHGIYFSACNTCLVEKNYLFANQAFGVHFWSNVAGSHLNNIIRYNRVEGRRAGATGTAFGIIIQTGSGNQVYRNLVIGQGSASVKLTGCISVGNSISGTIVYHNTCYDMPTGFKANNGSTGSLVRNNIFNLINTAIEDLTSGQVTASNNICSTNDTTPANTCSAGVTSTPGFVNAAGLDFTLASGATAIDAGVAISGFASNGSAPDVGAFETFAGSSAAIDLNVMDIQLGMDLAIPVLPASGITGFTVACTGHVSCPGSPTVASASRKTGTDSVIRLTISGITDDTCAATQTWTWSYTPGNVTDSALVGGTLNQSMFAASTQAVTETCSGSSTPQPGTPHIEYNMDEGTGTTLDDASANEIDGTHSAGTWTTGHSGNGITFTDASAETVTMGYGSGENPLTTSHTIAFAVNIPANLTSATRNYYGSSVGTNQRNHISTTGGTWRIAIQDENDSTASDLAVVAGWNRVCLTFDKDTPGSGTGTATLTVSGVASTSGAVKTYTTHSWASNIVLGSPFSNSPGVTYDDFVLYRTLESCADDFAAWEQGSPSPTGTFAQVTHQFQLLRTPATSHGALAASVSVVVGGAVALVTQIDCTVADCAPTGARLFYSKNGGAFQAVPDVCVADSVCFYGQPDADILSGTVECCLSGALTANDGPTNTTAAAVPVFDLAQNGSFVRRSILKFGASVVGGTDQFCFKEYHQTDLALNSYTPTGGACVTIISMAAGVGF